jgi:two-component system LytT family response regulator
MKNTYKALIIDDEPTAREILESHLKKIDLIEVVGSCKNAMEGFSKLNETQVDLIFLDINMPEISGLQFAKTLDKNTKVIFTTAYREYALDGFDLQAVDYLMKPISLERLIKAINKFLGESIPLENASQKEIQAENSDFIFVRSDRKMIKIDFEDIIYIESLSDYLKIHTAEKTITTRETISNIETKLPHKKFLRCHRSFIVSIPRIDSFTNEYIEVNKTAISISRSYRSAVLEKLGSFNA